MTVTKQDVINAAKSVSATRSLLGKTYRDLNYDVFCFGNIPTDKVEIELDGNIIVGIKVFSGLNWSARGGYGSPVINVWLGMDYGKSYDDYDRVDQLEIEDIVG